MWRMNSQILVVGAFLAVVGPVSGQQIHLPPAVSQSQGMGGVPVTGRDDVQKQQAQAANVQRQIEIRRDTEKMAELTQELKEYLAKADQGVVSIDVVKKAEQIEKLAHSVKSKLKQSF